MSRLILVLAAVFAAAGGALQAHHSFAAEFDINLPVNIRGTVTKLDWMNPHSWIHLDVKTPDGKVEQWEVETAGPTQLMRRGMRRTDFPIGVEVQITGYRARYKTHVAAARSVKKADGTEALPDLGAVNVFCRLVIAAVVFATALPAAAQTTPTSPWPGPRTPDGQPDVQGQWNKQWPGSNGANFDLEEGIDPLEIKLTGRDPKNFPRPRVVQTPDGLIPYQPWARTLRGQIRKNVFTPTRPEHVDSNARCLQMGIPRQSLDNGFDLVQTPGQVIFFYPYNNAYRIIALDGRAHVDPRIKLWQGDSIGRWEGNTLLVDVRNLNEHAWYDAYGNFHSSELRLEERWVFVDGGRVHYEVTSHDDQVFTRPWTARNEFARAREPVEMWETACFEGERNLQHRLAPTDGR